MNPTRRNMLIAFVLGLFGLFRRRAIAAPSSKTLSEFIRIKAWPDGGESRISFTSVHRRSDMQLLQLEVTVKEIATLPTLEAYTYFAWARLYGFELSEPDRCFMPSGDYHIPFRVFGHSNQFTLHAARTLDLLVLANLDLTFDLTDEEARRTAMVVEAVSNYDYVKHARITDDQVAEIWDDSRERNYDLVRQAVRDGR